MFGYCDTLIKLCTMTDSTTSTDIDIDEPDDAVINKLMALGIASREQCVDAYLASDDKSNINEMKQYLISNHSANDNMTDSYTDDIKENIDDQGTCTENDELSECKHEFELLPVGLLPKYVQQTFIVDEDLIEKMSPIHGWSLCDSTTFNVRRGPNYVSGQKSPSKEALYEPFAMDTYSVPYKINQITQFMNVQQYIEKYKYSINKTYPLPPILMINIMVPNYSPEITNYAHYDGKGYQVIIYAKLRENVQKLLQQHSDDDNTKISPSIKLLSRFVTESMTDTAIRDRFKCMGRVMNLKYTGFNFLTKKLISEYNAKPFLAKCSTVVHHEYGEYLSIDLDAHQFGYVAKKCWNYIKNIMENVIYDLAFVIEGHEDNELPEQILTSVRISKVAAQKQKQLPSIYVKKYDQMNSKKKAKMSV